MIQEIKGQKGNVVWKIDKINKTYEYFFISEGDQYKVIKTLLFKGYTKKPSCLNRNGFGFSRALKYFFYIIKDTFQVVDSIVVDTFSESKISGHLKNIKIVFNKDDYESIVSICNEIYMENSIRLREINNYQLNKLFPKSFKVENKIEYKKNTISKTLDVDNITDKLSVEDMSSIARIIPSLMEKSVVLKKSVLDKLLFVDIGKKVNSIKLSSIINEYEKLLKKTKQNENEWQIFFKKNLLFFNSSYILLLDKTNISITLSIPDFLLVDQFQCIDIFEIKRPDFSCLKHDRSHDNYYWSENSIKAIAQVEKYIYEIENNANTVIKMFHDKGYDLKIVRPKGFVLIGKREELTNTKMIDCFKILSSSLKNVQIIFYDDFLNSIRHKYDLLI